MSTALMSLATSGDIPSDTVEPILTQITASDAGGIFEFMWLLLALPAFGAAVLFVAGRRSNAWGHLLGVLMAVIPAGLAIWLLVALMGRPEESRTITQHFWDWTFVGTFNAEFAIRLDPLSIVFVLLITIVGGLIHIYSVGYMAEDPGRRLFFAMLNLFLAAMLLLVLADNYLLLYLGWEGVGLASYLLVGFWQYKDVAAVAAKKAFVMNRIGDVGLSIAIMLMFVTFGSVTFGDVFAAAPEADSTTMTLIGLALLLAATGKSAQYPLQAWLLDAMEGPTPVSALIHAATMVTAGVYLIVRSNAIFDQAPVALNVVLAVGLVTMIAGAWIGCAQDELKKALAGSTMSQIGYMFVAAGLGPAGYVFAIFHLVMHGMFKADLFLGSGSVMHAMNEERNMRFYGALRGVMIVTWITFICGFLGISGLPPFDSAFSKDDIIAAATSQNWFAGAVTIFAAGLTATYMTRMMAMTFFGKARWHDDAHPHESPQTMLWPMIILSFGAIFGGLFAVGVIGDLNILEWLKPVTGYEEAALEVPHWSLEVITFVVVIIGIVLTWMQFGMRDVPQAAPQHVTVLTKAGREELYTNTWHEELLMRPGQHLTRWLVWFDNKGIDGAVRGIASGIMGIGTGLTRTQTGYSRRYALVMVGGFLLLVAVFFLAWWF